MKAHQVACFIDFCRAYWRSRWVRFSRSISFANRTSMTCTSAGGCSLSPSASCLWPSAPSLSVGLLTLLMRILFSADSQHALGNQNELRVSFHRESDIKCDYIPRASIGVHSCVMAGNQPLPTHDDSRHQVVIGWGIAVIFFFLSYLIHLLSPADPFWACLGICIGIVIALRGHQPRWFIRHIEPQLIAGLPGRNVTSWRAWLLAIVLVLVIAGGVSCVFKWRNLSQQTIPPAPQIQKLSAQCSLLQDQSPCGISCRVSNTGNTPTRDAAIGFQGSLPLETQVYADSDTRVTLEESKTLPLPDAEGNFRKDEVAFTVKIPLLPPGADIIFKLKTVSSDNQKACRQVLKIQEFRKQMYEEFYAALVKSRVERLGDLPSISTVISAQAINGSLFIPGDLSSEAGRKAVTFMTSKEQQAVDSYTKIKGQYKAQFPPWKEYCDMPVWTVKQSSGTPFHFWRIPPDSTTYTYPTRKNTKITPLPDGSLRINTLPVPPGEYYCGERERGITSRDLLRLPRSSTRKSSRTD